MNYLKKQQEGMTLIEVVAAIVILSIVLITFFNFFINSSIFNNKNDSNIKAINITREQIVNFNNTYKSVPWSDIEKEFIVDVSNPGIYKKEWTDGDYIIEASIDSTIEPTLGSGYSSYYRELRKVQIKVWKDSKEGPPLSESFTYQEGG